MESPRSKSEQISVRVDREVLDALEEIGRSQAVPTKRNAVINAALKDYVDRYKKAARERRG